ncbi:MULTISPECIES: toll/interleukin-1 receptor domain-containing protein [unclassified Streptomyces]|uniref:toll/interleukin-1 receptor domain-containing protein n=1 Tax=unclassified Streptomyces TaxID=2593676 RepID=UPI00244368D2|nr:toll/interleukin-1 receptor domain-containing protein [Streptomyces sp. DH41]MDG9728644.1 toll/interleukin-1 receptor domain-containing protein [Streptomyces sp. DH41]
MTSPSRLTTELPEISNLIPRVAPFVGRDEEIAEVFTLLAEYQAVLLHDPEDRPLGYGTSQLAVAYCHTFTRRYEMAWMFDCGRERDPARLTERVQQELRRLRAAYEKARDEPLTGPFAVNWLLIYDNVADPDAVQEYFPEGNARILVTSRATGSWDERARKRVGPVDREEAAKIFKEVAQIDQWNADRLAETFDGHPGQLVRVAEEIRAGTVNPAEFISLTEIVRMAPAPGGASPRTPVPAPRRSDALGRDRTSLRTHILRSPVCRDAGSYRSWIAALREHTDAHLDEGLSAELFIPERVDGLLDIAFGEGRNPDFLRALATTVEEAADSAKTGQETARDIREIVEAAAARWNGTPPARPRPIGAPAPAQSAASCLFFVSWVNREDHAQEALAFHNTLQKAVAARRGKRELSTGYIDRTTRQGAQWEPRLIEAIRTTRLLVPLITTDYFASRWCRREWAVMMERIRGVGAEEGSEPIAILPVFWIRPPGNHKLPKDFTDFQYRALGGPDGEFLDDVYDLSTAHRKDRFHDYVVNLAKRMVEAAESPLPPLPRKRVMELPLAFPEVNGEAR